MRRVPARYVVAVLALAWALALLGEPVRMAGAFFSSPPSPLVKPRLYMPAIERDHRLISTYKVYLPFLTRR